jgi:hypothetical protein
VLMLLMTGIYDICHWYGLRWHDVYISSFLKTVIGVQATLRFCLSNLNGCNVCIADGKKLRSAALKLVQVARFTYQFPRQSVQAFK